MKVALLKSYFLWSHATGGERSQTATLAALARAGYTVSVRYAIPPGLPGEAYLRFREIIRYFDLPIIEERERGLSYEADGIPVQSVPVSGPPSTWIGSWLDELQPDIVCATAKDTYFLPVLAAFWTGPGIIFVQDLQSIINLGKRVSPEAIARLKRDNWTFVASSRFLKSRLNELLSIESNVLYPVVPQNPSGSLLPDSGPVIMFGTDEGKGIDIFQRIARAFPGREFAAVCGWHHTSPPAAEDIEVLPFELTPDSLLKHCRVVLVPSRYEEGFGRIAFEAMAHGRPVITSDRGALPEVVGNAGMVVPVPGEGISPDEWVHAVKSAMDKEKATGYIAAGLNRAREIIGTRNRQFRMIFGVPFPDPGSVTGFR